ncbi:carbonic anhydrase [Planctomicrobium sp. SH661]|uniref:carbonic anhydrase n=1 Tax=Planctomicrobium sp. SH661 TaxID=3448124 RepID=UPI003F5B28B9
MLQLVKGVHHFQREVFRDHRQLFENLAEGQSPSALFITCSDSRICPQLMTQSKPGELFILRVAGNIVPCYGAVAGGEAATIEYAVSVLGVRDIIVCGHSFCGAMSALVDGTNLDNLPSIKSYLQHAEATRRIMMENYKDVEDPSTRLTLTIKENVLVQLENLRTHPSVAAAISRGQLSLHGWVYQFESGVVKSYVPELDQFVPVGDARPELVSDQRRPQRVLSI